MVAAASLYKAANLVVALYSSENIRLPGFRLLGLFTAAMIKEILGIDFGINTNDISG